MALRNALGQFTSSALLAEERRRRFLKMVATELLVGDVILGEVESLLDGHGLTLTPMPQFVRDAIEVVARTGEGAVGAPIFEAIFGAALPAGVLSAMQTDAPGALAILERIIGFTVGLPFGTSQVHNGLKALLGDHAPEALLDAINKLPAELGMNFFIPQIMANVVDVATGTPLREAIAEQTRPFRLEWPQLRQLARLHAFDDAELRRRLVKIGVRDEDLGLLAKIDQQVLPVADLQQAFLQGIRGESWVREQLGVLGFSDDAQDVIVQLYLNRAETAGGDQLRSVAQRGFLDDHLTEGQYRAILKQVNVPPASIDLEVEAAILTKSWNAHAFTLGELKALTLDGTLSDAEAVLQLQQLRYTNVQAAALVASWHKAQKATRGGLTVPAVLRYQLSKVLTAVQAYDALVNLGVSSQDARFLTSNPSQLGGIIQVPLSEKTIVAAYLDGVINQDAAATLLHDRGVAPKEAELVLAIATAKLVKGPKPKAPHRALSEAQVLAAYKAGLAEPSWVLRELVTLGYSDQDAQVILAIEQTALSGKLPLGWVTLN